MNKCCIFDYEDAPTAFKNFKYNVIKDIGKTVYTEDGKPKHSAHTWHSGGRKIVQCIKCGAIFVYQHSEYWPNNGDPDSYYYDYFLVDSIEQANFLNDKFDGWELERSFEGLKLWTLHDVWYWNKKDFIK